ncbi:MAG: hypothetical protein JST90_09170 [Bacteroidetes bacterium]|nr:hypothetical protein [Bacteroidota bacterium]
MSAENGNRYAEKWTYEATMKALEKINTFAMMDDTLYLGMALARAGYYDDIWRYWRKKWARNYEIIHEMKMLMQHFEARIYTNTAHGKIPLRLGIFTLQHHYGWGREPQQEDISYVAEADRHLSQTLSKGEGLMQTAGDSLATVRDFPEGEGLMQTADLSQPSPKERALIQTDGDSQNSTTTDRLSEGEDLIQTGGDSQRHFKEEDSNVKAVSVDEVTTKAQNEVAAPAASAKSTKRYPMELTPEELEMEVGISDVREIERRLREEDPELAEFDDLDEDLEWEVETPETYKG